MNSFGRLFRVSIYGESHGGGVGVLIDGVPAGLKINIDDLNVLVFIITVLRLNFFYITTIYIKFQWIFWQLIVYINIDNIKVKSIMAEHCENCVIFEWNNKKSMLQL